MFVLGDLNDILLNANSKLLRIIKQNKLTQIVNGPTRVTPTSATLLDVVITNKPELVLMSDTIPNIIADHDLITTTINISKPKTSPTIRTFRELNQYNKDTLCKHILDETHSLNKITYTDDVNEQVNILTSVINHGLDHCAPLVTKQTCRPPAPWMTDEIREAITAKNKAHAILKMG